MSSIPVTNNTSASRYEVSLPGEPAVLEYEMRDGKLALTHTGVPEEAEGQGIAGALTRFALDDARAQGLKVLPLCPYVKSYITRHPEYADLAEG